jgi:hypothetical protein
VGRSQVAEGERGQSQTGEERGGWSQAAEGERGQSREGENVEESGRTEARE